MQVSSQEQPAEKIAAASEDLKAQDAPPPSVIDDNYSDDPDEDDKPVTLMDRLTETLLDSAPITAGDSNDLARFGVIAPMTLLYFAVFFSTLLWFTISGAQTIAAQHFLSVLEQEGDICSSVPYYINNVFSADSSGRWSTAPLYLANESIYQLHFTGEAVTTSQFYSAMQQFSANVKTLGAKAAERDLAFTYLALNNYGFVHEPTKLQFTSKALAGTTLGHMKIWSTAVSSRLGVCGSAFVSSIQVSTQTVGMTWSDLNVSDTSAGGGTKGQSPCPLQIPDMRNLFGWKTEVHGSQFALSFDLRSMSTCLALNMGIITTADNLVMTHIGQDPTLFGLPEGEFWVDPSYLGMRPVFCLSAELKGGADKPDVCFLFQLGIYPSPVPFTDSSVATLFYPSMQSYGDFIAGSQANGPCQCPRDANNRFCNIADFLVSIFYDIGDKSEQSVPITDSAGFQSGTTTIALQLTNNLRMVQIGLYFQSFLVADPDKGDIKQANASYPVSIEASDCYYSPTLPGCDSTNSSSSSPLQAAFDAVCPDKKCAALLFEFANTDIFAPVNPTGASMYAFSDVYQLDDRVVAGDAYVTGTPTTRRRLMCMDLIAFQAALDKLAGMPPVQLVQPFYDCHNSFRSAFLTSIGVANGYAQIAAAIFISVFASVVVKFINWRGGKRQQGGSPALPAILSPRKKAELKEALLNKSVKTLNTNQHAMLPLLEALAQASTDPRVERQYHLLKYNHRTIKLLGKGTLDTMQPPLRPPPEAFAEKNKLKRPKLRRREWGAGSLSDSEASVNSLSRINSLSRRRVTKRRGNDSDSDSGSDSDSDPEMGRARPDPENKDNCLLFFR